MKIPEKRKKKSSLACCNGVKMCTFVGSQLNMRAICSTSLFYLQVGTQRPFTTKIFPF